jgi:hypothetical protein
MMRLSAVVLVLGISFDGFLLELLNGKKLRLGLPQKARTWARSMGVSN